MSSSLPLEITIPEEHFVNNHKHTIYIPVPEWGCQIDWNKFLTDHRASATYRSKLCPAGSGSGIIFGDPAPIPATAEMSVGRIGTSNYAYPLNRTLGQSGTVGAYITCEVSYKWPMNLQEREAVIHNAIELQNRAQRTRERNKRAAHAKYVKELTTKLRNLQEQDPEAAARIVSTVKVD